MAREKEIKIELIDLSIDDFIERIQSNGFFFENKLKQEDIYFDTKDWSLYEQLAALRIRKTNDVYTSFSFKKIFYIPNKADKYYVEEIEAKLPLTNKKEFEKIIRSVGLNSNMKLPNCTDALIELLKMNGLFDEQHMFKERMVFKNRGNEIVIDAVDKVGVIIELECQDDEPLDLVNTFLDKSEWERSIEGTSYKWLKNVKGLSSHLTNLNKFKNNPSWNVLPFEQSMYKQYLR